MTNLPNRALFQDRFSRVIETAKRNQTKFAVLYLHLNNF
ncbi:MAG: diguanylate cyclase [Gammaproteobacteria bacterium]